jgi:hypothetical protein
METKDIIEQIEKLPVEKRMLIIEQSLKSIRERELKARMGEAVEELQEEYKINHELTAFTVIDFDNFYEPR